MFDTLKDLKEGLRQLVERLDPEVLEPAFATTLVEDFAFMQNLCAAGKALAARRVASSGAWQAQGDRTPAHWMARKTGSSVGQAAGILETAKRLEDLSGTDQAVRAGKLSETQAGHIASAAGANPAFEGELLKAAETEGVGQLKERCTKIKATSVPDEIARHESIRRGRYLRNWTDQLGAFRLDGRFTPEAGALVMAVLEPYKDQAFRQARKAGRREPYDAYAADALLAMARDAKDCLVGQSSESAQRVLGSDTPQTSSKPPRRRLGASAMIHVRVDHSALIRGFARAGETCEIPGIGPIPVATVRALENDAYLSVIVTDGADIKAVCHSRRYIPARLRTALLERDQHCVVPGCAVREHLQIDHNVDFAQKGPTRLDNLSRLCTWHHYLKTHQGYRLSGGPGNWLWEPPDKSGGLNSGRPRRRPRKPKTEPDRLVAAGHT